MRAQRRNRRVALVSFSNAVLFLACACLNGFAQPQEQKPPAADASSKPSASQPAPANASPATRPAGVEQDTPVIVNADLVTVTVTVTDIYGRYVTGLNQKAFSIFDDKIEQEIAFFSNDDTPVSLGVIFDVSNSMTGDKIARAREALSRFVETSHTSDEYFLIGFNTRAQLLLDKTRDSNSLLDKLTFVQTKGRTALYDACYLGVEKVTRGAHQKRAVLLISDGQDNSSRYTFSELRRLLKESDVIIYSVGILNSHDDTSGLGMQGRSVLDELAGVSGGKSFYPSTAAEMNDTFEKIALELRNQYSIGYRPSNFANDGKWHKLKVKIKAPRGLPRLFWRNKEGYYAVTNPR
ncbi:MAG TPA: VWA domain-containing protein [Pyrinomonadaceae bacterium]|jgi:Ca-activated chloride channel family protein|nr:VWA domain-containing protein [Pyrinomonadaceae bacterium]